MFWELLFLLTPLKGYTQSILEMSNNMSEKQCCTYKAKVTDPTFGSDNTAYAVLTGHYITFHT